MDFLTEFATRSRDLLLFAVPILGAVASVYLLLVSKRYLRTSDGAKMTDERQPAHFDEAGANTGLHLEDRQYALLKEYHSQSLSQSKISFWFSLSFGALGFLVILVGLLSVQSDRDFSKQTLSFISMGSGVVIDAVSALFFIQSNKARRLMIDFFDKLRADRKLEESLKLVQAMEDPGLRARVQAVLPLNFSAVSIPADLHSRFLDLNTDHQALTNSLETAAKGDAASKDY